jgi:hypothetical protein
MSKNMVDKYLNIYYHDQISWPNDVERIQKILRKNMEYRWEDTEVQKLWRWYSEEYRCAGWLELPDTDEDLEDILF